MSSNGLVLGYDIAPHSKMGREPTEAPKSMSRICRFHNWKSLGIKYLEMYFKSCCKVNVILSFIFP